MRIWLVEAPDSAAAAIALESLARDPAVAWAEPNRPREIAGSSIDVPFPDDPLFRDGRQWGLRNLGPGSPYGGVAGADIRATEAWARSTGSNDLLLAVADTGIDPDQPDLGGPMPDGGPRIVCALNVSGEQPVSAILDSFGHGTLVAGVMAARTNDGIHFDSLGAAGVCGGDGRANGGCRIVPIKIAPGRSGNASSFAIASAALYATRVGARAMNLSFGGPGASRVERLALAWAIAHGCVVVAAAGNHSDDLPIYPAANSVDGLCIQVGASDESDRRTAWSSHGPGLDLVAPGTDIWTTFMTDPAASGVSYPGYCRTAGTSYAAPFVTGTVGLLAAARPELTDVDFQRIIRESAHDVADTGVDALTGWGRLDAAAALEQVAPAIGIWHDEVAGQTFRALECDTLAVAEGGFGTLDLWRGAHRAERIEVTARVALPDSFVGPVRVWPRVAGTTTTRGGFRLPCFAPWAEVEEWSAPGTALAGAPRAFTLRGSVYRVLDAGTASGGDEYVPLPPDQARFGFTVIGSVDRGPRTSVAARDPTSFSVAPNPFRSRARIAGPPGARLAIFDLSGRRLREAVLDERGGFSWDGRDDSGRRTPPGVYLIRGEDRRSVRKLVRIE
ncbi:MAG TPA: S8 family serine peptidase [Terriglobales bacterium]|nr:S8 family serine peptidase [Terriglobales bacterium]